MDVVCKACTMLGGMVVPDCLSADDSEEEDCDMFTGSMRDLLIWDVALSEVELAAGVALGEAVEEARADEAREQARGGLLPFPGLFLRFHSTSAEMGK